VFLCFCFAFFSRTARFSSRLSFLKVLISTAKQGEKNKNSKKKKQKKVKKKVKKVKNKKKRGGGRGGGGEGGGEEEAEEEECHSDVFLWSAILCQMLVVQNRKRHIAKRNGRHYFPSSTRSLAVCVIL
jgi:hypothetical protein